MPANRGADPVSKQFTRRHWGREAYDMYRRETSMLRGADGDYSMLRWMLASFLVAFLLNFPAANEWTEWNVKALAVIVFALIFDQLASRIPMTEMLDALRALSLSMAAKGVSAIGSVVTSVTKKEQVVTTTNLGDSEATNPEATRAARALAKWPVQEK